MAVSMRGSVISVLAVNLFKEKEHVKDLTEIVSAVIVWRSSAKRSGLYENCIKLSW